MTISVVPALVSSIKKFKPDISWFERGSSAGIHGMAHTTRVLVYAQVLARMAEQEGLLADRKSLGWAAALHDIKRIDDGLNRDHGYFSSLWVKDNLHNLDPEADVDKVAYLCHFHSVDDADAPEMNHDLMIFKDADALDRYRWPLMDFGGPKMEFFRTESAKILLPLAKKLTERTDLMRKRPDYAFEKIIDCAVDLNLLSYR